ncbi:WD40-repeat-containing domain protein [Coprinopsis sp. MPI-PUGE-AT-0042]|nr:WD40-repeat-containing domain protein [Coprinopsis sp. MPI-PUGE-AT-0042]
MPKHPRKRQEDLKNHAFGDEFSTKGKEKEVLDDDDEMLDLRETVADSRGLSHLVDQDLFFVDDEVDQAEALSLDGEGLGEDRDKEDASGRQLERTLPPSALESKTRSACVSLLAARRRKLRQAIDEDSVTAKEYETRLRTQFEAINPEPAWAKKARKIAKDINQDDEETPESTLSSTNGILKRSKKKAGKIVLAKGEIQLERLALEKFRVVAFHPGTTASILGVATADRRVRLFNVDGHLNPLLTTLHFPNLPMTSTTSVLFHPSGDSMLLSGPRPFFYTYDLPSGTATHHARGLWGTTFNNINDSSAALQRRRKRGGDQGGGNGDGESLSLTSFSTHGDLLAVAGRGGYVHLVDWKTGAGQVISSLKCSSSGGGGGIQGLWWVPPGLSGGALGDNAVSSGNSKLAVLTGDAEIYLWDVGQRKCIKRWQDEGGFRSAGRVLAGGSGGAGYIAVGSNSGYVNVYGSDSFSNQSSDAGRPKPLKSIGNLTTPISHKEKKDALRMVHLPSLTTYSNWPTSGTPLGHVTAIDFSPRRNTRGRVLLYHLKDYGVW